jgi:D-glycero-alpha-D-manno-heptose-7-phosphate kinase
MQDSDMLTENRPSPAGRKSIVRARAPLRISFCGGGTDVPPYSDLYGGCVLSCTIDKYAHVSLRSRDSETVRVESPDLGLITEFTRHDPHEGEAELARALIRRFEERAMDCYMHCDAPPGSGLGSSSAMIVALIGALARRQGRDFTPHEVAELALRIEREDLGILGGAQDQYAASFGGFNFMEFAKDGVIVNPLRVSSGTLDELHYNLLLCYTGKTRFGPNIIGEQTDNVVAEKSEVMLALAQMKELAVAMKRALLTDNCHAFGALLHEAWLLKRNLASGITDPEIDEVYDVALRAGASGGKLLGAGGGGYLLFFVPFTKRNAVRAKLEDMGKRAVDFQFDHRGVHSWSAPQSAWAD